MFSARNLFIRYFLQLLFIATGVLLLAAPFIWLHIHHPTISDAVDNIFSHYAPYFTIFRWLLMVLLYLLWPRFIQFVANQQSWDMEKLNFWFKQRLRIMIWLIIFELLIGEKVLSIVVKLV